MKFGFEFQKQQNCVLVHVQLLICKVCFCSLHKAGAFYLAVSSPFDWSLISMLQSTTYVNDVIWILVVWILFHKYHCSGMLFASDQF